MDIYEWNKQEGWSTVTSKEVAQWNYQQKKIKSLESRIEELESLFKSQGGCIKSAICLVNENKKLQQTITKLRKALENVSKKALINENHSAPVVSSEFLKGYIDTTLKECFGEENEKK